MNHCDRMNINEDLLIVAQSICTKTRQLLNYYAASVYKQELQKDIDALINDLEIISVALNKIMIIDMFNDYRTSLAQTSVFDKYHLIAKFIFKYENAINKVNFSRLKIKKSVSIDKNTDTPTSLILHSMKEKYIYQS